jgi:hypothetical protein
MQERKQAEKKKPRTKENKVGKIEDKDGKVDTSKWPGKPPAPSLNGVALYQSRT